MIDQEKITMGVLSKNELLTRKTKIQKPREVELPSGGSVLMRVPTGKDYRDWKKYLRDERGEMIEARAELGDELLVASLLVDDQGTRMFSNEEVMSGAMNEIIQLDLEQMKVQAYELYGQRGAMKIVLDEDREKN